MGVCWISRHEATPAVQKARAAGGDWVFPQPMLHSHFARTQCPGVKSPAQALPGKAWSRLSCLALKKDLDRIDRPFPFVEVNAARKFAQIDQSEGRAGRHG